MKINTSVIAFALSVVLSGCSHAHDDGLGHHHDHGEAHEMSAEIHLEPEMAEKFGVLADTVAPGAFYQVVITTGEVLNTPSNSTVVAAPTSGIVRFSPAMKVGNKVSAGQTLASVSSQNISGGDANAAARAALDAAKRELDRVTPLYQDGIVSQKDYNAALQAYETAKSQYSPSAASGSARTVGPGVITDVLVGNGAYVEAGTPIATVASATRLTLRVDVPDRYQRLVPRLNSGNISSPNHADVLSMEQLHARRTSASDPSMRVQPGYVPIYFEIDNDGSLLPGSVVSVYLQGDSRGDVISLPREALVEQQGKYYVYRQIDEDCYEKLPVTVGATDGMRYEIVDGLSGGECIVTAGASAVRLAESSAVAPEGHSHSH